MSFNSLKVKNELKIMDEIVLCSNVIKMFL